MCSFETCFLSFTGLELHVVFVACGDMARELGVMSMLTTTTKPLIRLGDHSPGTKWLLSRIKASEEVLFSSGSFDVSVSHTQLKL